MITKIDINELPIPLHMLSIHLLKRGLLVCMCVLSAAMYTHAQKVVSQTFTSNGTFNVPAGVTQVT
ncbi:MAG TPA: hypothetical protein PKC24_10325, partial [Cyclobacteriaceae bacterium]|nr:hypothetical protein [Cyclobacteriaceae bacterium]